MDHRDAGATDVDDDDISAVAERSVDYGSYEQNLLRGDDGETDDALARNNF